MHHSQKSRRNSSFLTRLVYLYIFSFPFFGFSIFNQGGRGLGRPDWIIGGLLLLLFGLGLLSKHLKIAQSPANKFVFLYMCSGVLSIVNLFNASNAQLIDFATKGMQLLMVTPIFFVISSLPIGKREIRTMLRVWVFSGFAVSIHAIYQLFGQLFDLPFATFQLTNPTVSSGLQSARSLFGYTQPTSVFQEPSYMGAFLGPCLLLAITMVLTNKAEEFFFKKKPLNWLLLITLTLAVFLSNSQAILAALLATLAVVYERGLLKRSRIVKLSLLSVTALLLAGLLLRIFGIDFLSAFSLRTQYLILNIVDPENTAQVTSYANRYERSLAAFQIWARYPILGVGLGNMGYYTDVHEWSNNPWAQLLVEQGVLGFLSLIMLFVTLWQQLYGLLERHGEESFWRSVIIAMLLLLILTFFDAIFTLNWTHPQRIFTFAIINLIYIQATAAQATPIDHIDDKIP